MLGLVLSIRGRFDRAIEHFREVERLSPGSPELMKGVAWILATHPDSGVREGQWAVRLAERASELTNNQSAEVLDTLGAAYAAAGQFDPAVATAQAAFALASTARADKLSAAIRRRLELYRQGKPYREAMRAGHP